MNRVAIETELRSLRIRREQLDGELLELQRAEWAAEAALKREKLRIENRSRVGTVKLTFCVLFVFVFGPPVFEPLRWLFGAGVAKSLGEAFGVLAIAAPLAALGAFKVWQILNDRQWFDGAPEGSKP